MTRRTAARVMIAVLLGCSRPGSAADIPGDPVEAALAAYCDKHHVKRDKLSPVAMDLVPGAKVFRHELPAVPDKQPWRELPIRYALAFVEGKSGKLTEIKWETYDDRKPRSYEPLFEAMKRAGRTVKTEKEAAAVLRDLMRLQWWTWSAEVDAERVVKEIEVHGLYRNRPNTFSAGHLNGKPMTWAWKWTRTGMSRTCSADTSARLCQRTIIGPLAAYMAR
jgi:hypothetical protein